MTYDQIIETVAKGMWEHSRINDPGLPVWDKAAGGELRTSLIAAVTAGFVTAGLDRYLGAGTYT